MRDKFAAALEATRRSYRFFMVGYVVMPEHVHLLVGEPERRLLATAIQAMRNPSLAAAHRNLGETFWQARYYDLNVFSDHKRIEKLRYIYRNPVARGLVSVPEDWK